MYALQSYFYFILFFYDLTPYMGSVMFNVIIAFKKKQFKINHQNSDFSFCFKNTYRPFATCIRTRHEVLRDGYTYCKHAVLKQNHTHMMDIQSVSKEKSLHLYVLYMSVDTSPSHTYKTANLLTVKVRGLWYGWAYLIKLREVMQIRPLQLNQIHV